MLNPWESDGPLGWVGRSQGHDDYRGNQVYLQSMVTHSRVQYRQLSKYQNYSKSNYVDFSALTTTPTP